MEHSIEFQLATAKPYGTGGNASFQIDEEIKTTSLGNAQYRYESTDDGMGDLNTVVMQFASADQQNAINLKMIQTTDTWTYYKSDGTIDHIDAMTRKCGNLRRIILDNNLTNSAATLIRKALTDAHHIDYANLVTSERFLECDLIHTDADAACTWNISDNFNLGDPGYLVNAYVHVEGDQATRLVRWTYTNRDGNEISP